MPAQLRQGVDGFQARCLRVLLRVAPSYVSRIANKTVLAKAQQIPYTRQLLLQQLLLYGKVARAPDDDVLRRLTFVARTLEPATNAFVRKVGRPRHEWASLLKREALKFTLQNLKDWSNRRPFGKKLSFATADRFELTP